MIVVKEDCIDSMPFGYVFKEEVVVEEVIEEVVVKQEFKTNETIK